MIETYTVNIFFKTYKHKKEQISIKTKKEELNETLSTTIIKDHKRSQYFRNLKHCFVLNWTGLVLFFTLEMMLVTVDFITNIRASAILIVFQTLYKLQQSTVFSFATNVIPNIKDRGLMQGMLLSLPL